MSRLAQHGGRTAADRSLRHLPFVLLPLGQGNVETAGPHLIGMKRHTLYFHFSEQIGHTALRHPGDIAQLSCYQCFRLLSAALASSLSSK
ncbi:hypothetical protein D3C76_1576340 [compost metagenome]